MIRYTGSAILTDYSSPEAITSFQVVFCSLSFLAKSILIFVAIHGPLYTNEVYNWTTFAPERAYSRASSADDTPPEAIIGIAPFVNCLTLFTKLSALGFSGGPERPPSSVMRSGAV